MPDIITSLFGNNEELISLSVLNVPWVFYSYRMYHKLYDIKKIKYYQLILKYSVFLCFEIIFIVMDNLTLTNKEQVIWAEKNSIEQEKNLSSYEKKMMSDTIINTNPESSKKECKDIGTNWTKNCNKCGKLQCYNSKYALNAAIKNNRVW